MVKPKCFHDTRSEFHGPCCPLQNFDLWASHIKPGGRAALRHLHHRSQQWLQIEFVWAHRRSRTLPIRATYFHRLLLGTGRRTRPQNPLLLQECVLLIVKVRCVTPQTTPVTITLIGTKALAAVLAPCICSLLFSTLVRATRCLQQLVFLSYVRMMDSAGGRRPSPVTSVRCGLTIALVSIPPLLSPRQLVFSEPSLPSADGSWVPGRASSRPKYSPSRGRSEYTTSDDMSECSFDFLGQHTTKIVHLMSSGIWLSAIQSATPAKHVFHVEQPLVERLKCVDRLHRKESLRRCSLGTWPLRCVPAKRPPSLHAMSTHSVRFGFASAQKDQVQYLGKRASPFHACFFHLAFRVGQTVPQSLRGIGVAMQAHPLQSFVCGVVCGTQIVRHLTPPLSPRRVIPLKERGLPIPRVSTMSR